MYIQLISLNSVYDNFCIIIIVPPFGSIYIFKDFSSWCILWLKIVLVLKHVSQSDWKIDVVPCETLIRFQARFCFAVILLSLHRRIGYCVDVYRGLRVGLRLLSYKYISWRQNSWENLGILFGYHYLSNWTLIRFWSSQTTLVTRAL